jgi:sporulation protein YlmC with PRC-barrel domain
MLLGSTAMAPVAFAQDATGTTTTPPAATGTAPVSPDANGGATDMNSTSGTSTTTGAANTTDTTGAASTTAQSGTTGAAGSATYLTEQAENQISVNDFMGQAIYTADKQSIGDINDLLVQNDGGVVAAVVGVGGFLGIGEKNVAIPFDKITITREGGDGENSAEKAADAEVRLTTTETAESLKNAPEFRTLDDQAADAGTTATTGTAEGTTGTGMPADGSTTSSTTNN